jgi:peptidoglycan-associated lipoprotein
MAGAGRPQRIAPQNAVVDARSCYDHASSSKEVAMNRSSAALILVPVIALGLAVAGCAKRPATTQAAAPPPTGDVRPRMEPTPPAARPTPPSTAVTPSRPSMTPPPPAAMQPARPAQKDFAAVSDLKDVFFDFDKYDIKATQTEALDTSAKWLQQHGGHLVLIEGHADERGTNEYNLTLGERRAKATMDYLVSRGIQAARITITSFGEERPACADHSEGCWAKNRRAHFLVKPR